VAYQITDSATAEAASGGDLREAAQVYGRFHRFPAQRVCWARCQGCMPSVLVDLGELRALVYRSDRGHPGDPRTFVHFMETPPRLACDASGRQLYVLGGCYRVTARGIEG
jgi:hypothetical protein